MESGLPNVPTIAEAGVPNYEMGDWVGIVAPAGFRGVLFRQRGVQRYPV